MDSRLRDATFETTSPGRILFPDRNDLDLGSIKVTGPDDRPEGSARQPDSAESRGVWPPPPAGRRSARPALNVTRREKFGSRNGGFLLLDSRLVVQGAGMKTTALTLLLLLLSAFANAQLATVIVETSDPQTPIEIPDGKVLEIKNFVQFGGDGVLMLSVGTSTMRVLNAANTLLGGEAGNGHCFAGPASIQIVRSSGKVCLTYRIFDNEEPVAVPLQPIVQVRTICRCRKGR